MTKTQSELEQEVRDLIRNNVDDVVSSRQTYAEGETVSYSDGTLSYTLSNTPVSSIRSISGTSGGESYTFEWNTDYTNTNSGFTFTSDGTKPDDATDVSVNYYHGTQWVILGYTNTNIGMPYIILDDINEYTEREYLSIETADCSLRVGVYIVAQTRSELNTLSDSIRDLFHNNLDVLSFYHVRKISSQKRFFQYQETGLRDSTKNYIRGYLDDILLEFYYKVNR